MISLNFKSKSGVTIVEAIIGMILISVAALAFMDLFDSTQKHITNALEESGAVKGLDVVESSITVNDRFIPAQNAPADIDAALNDAQVSSLRCFDKFMSEMTPVDGACPQTTSGFPEYNFEVRFIKVKEVDSRLVRPAPASDISKIPMSRYYFKVKYFTDAQKTKVNVIEFSRLITAVMSY